MSKESLDSIDAKLSEMLTDSMRIYDLSMNCLLGDTNLDTVRDDLYSTDKKINELHRDVRREMTFILQSTQEILISRFYFPI